MENDFDVRTAQMLSQHRSMPSAPPRSMSWTAKTILTGVVCLLVGVAIGAWLF